MTRDEILDDAIAIVGMAGRFPGARTIDEYWANLTAGVRSIRTFSDDELIARGVARELLRDPNYVKAGTIVDDVDRFDATFFGYTPREAELMDPQHRLFLETAWEALEHAGIDPENCPGTAGLFAGTGSPAYLLLNLVPRKDVLSSAGSLQIGLSNEPDSLATRVSYKLNLRGPSLAIQTFCSTSLVAVHMACQSLLTHESDLMLAGGVSLSVPHGVGYLYQEGGILSPDGHCRAFDARAQGSVMGNGVGVVVLRRLEEALADGDEIYAVIRGSAVNNDGVRKVGYTAPGLRGQMAVILGALSNSGVPADTIAYVEGHGTATKLGDTVELDAMIQAFRQSTQRTAFCALASVKPNIGHLDRASGVAGLIKTALALHHGLLPPSLDFEGATVEIDLANSPFFVNTALREWPRAVAPRRAGVSSFGLGGTNAHVIVEDSPRRESSDPARPEQLLVWSAKTAAALDAATARLAAYLTRHPDANLADVAWTLATGRTAFNHRRMLVARDVADALRRLAAREYDTAEQAHRSGDASVMRSADRRASLRALGRAWLDGHVVDWRAVYAGERRRKVALPPYPFERQRHWLDSTAVAPSISTAKQDDIADWFYRAAWRTAPLGDGRLSTHTWLVIGGDRLGEAVARRLDARHQADPVVIDRTALDGVTAIVHMGSLDEPRDRMDRVARFRETQRRGYYSVLACAQMLTEGRLVVVTRGMRAVRSGESPDADQATVSGLLKVIGQENLSLRPRSVDVDDEDLDKQAERIAAESLRGTEPVVAWRGAERWVEEYAPARLEQKASLRERGVYLITGAFGPVGLAVAEHLARQCRARLALIGRRGSEAHEDDVQRIEALGADVLAVACNAADRDAMRAALAQVRERFGSMHGVVHAAGIADAAPLDQLTADRAEPHFRAKAEALYVLEDLLDGEPQLDFCVVFSSLSSVLGGLGFGGYAAANSFIDAFVARHNASGRTPWTSVAWDTWQVRSIETGGLGATVAAYVMTPAEALDAWERTIAVPGVWVNSTGNLDARIRQWLLLESIDDPSSAVADSDRDADAPIALAAPQAEWERRMARVWEQALGLDSVGLEDNFFDLGGNSLIALQLIARIKQEFHVRVPAVALFEAPSVRALSAYLRPEISWSEDTERTRLVERRQRAARSDQGKDVAIIAMAGRFPGADSIEQFWRNLCDGVESVSRFTDEELRSAGIDPSFINDPDYVKARPILSDVEHFDAALFGYTPREAELLDPQQRLFQECAWEALERAGYDPQRYGGLIGVFGGTNLNTYLMRLATDPTWTEQLLPGTGYENDKDSLTTNVSYKLNLRGPSVAVQTFCSTSLVATHLACRSLRGGECDVALAGGVSVRVPVKAGHLYQEGDQLSRDGHCRTFDARATGTLFGDGVGIVVLKRLADALEDGDTIHAVIRGSAVNNDGALKVGYTAPSVNGQSEVVATALADAGVSAADIEYVEAHGTATHLGDPIEVAALTKAFRHATDAQQYCAIGSVKPNVGHLDRAAGVTGLIKTVLALERETIPPLLHFEQPNPEIEFANSPFYVATALTPWPKTIGRPRRAGVNALGVGGTNAHLVVEEAPAQPSAVPSAREWHLLMLSARTPAALDAAADRLRVHLDEHPEVDLADVAYTLQVGRRVMEHRRVLVCRNRDDAIAALELREGDRVWSTAQKPVHRGVAFVIGRPGGSNADVGRALYARDEAYRTAIDRCNRILKAATHEVAAVSEFVGEWALAQMWVRWGVKPTAVLGVGIGEYVAACLAGIMTLEDALSLVVGATDGRALSLRAPRTPILSAASGTWLTSAQGVDPAYWSSPERETARFAECIDELMRDPEQIVLDLGPSRQLSDAIRQHPSCNATDVSRVVTALPAGGDHDRKWPSTLATLGQLWLLNVTIDWTGFYGQERRRRIALPTYRFERQRCWIDPGSRTPIDSLPPRRDDVSDWFAVASWTRTARRPPGSDLRDSHCWLVLVDDEGVGTELAALLEQRRQHVVVVSRGDAWKKVSANAYTVRPTVRADYDAVLQDLERDGHQPQRVVHLWTLGGDGDTDAWLARGFYSLLALAPALAERGLEACRIDVISSSMQRITGAEPLIPAKATVLGPCKVIPQEYSTFTTVSLDVEPSTPASEILRDLLADADHDIVALRGGDRFVQRFEPLTLTPGSDVRLRPRGVYLITGGLGGIALALAEHLVTTVQARLVLVGRTALPPRSEWSALIRKHGDRAIGLRLQMLERLEARGADVLALQADVSDRGAVDAVVRRTIEHYGTLNGVVHIAGVPGVGLLPFKTPESAAQVLAPKVQGTLALSTALERIPLDFLVLFSSVTSATGGGPGQADYCAANAFVDAWARQNAHQHGRTVAIGWGEWLWDAWREGLQGFPAEVRQQLIAARDRYGIRFDEGMRAFEAVLAGDVPHVFVTTQDIDRMVAASRRETTAAAMEQFERQRLAQTSHPRPHLTSSFTTPASALETRIATIWSQALGIDPIGADDNFFELGGNSLLGLTVMNRLRKELKLGKLPAQLLYEAPTVATLARHLEDSGEVASEPRTSAHIRVARTAEPPAGLSAVAIVGIAGRFPGAGSVDAFWRNVANGVRSIRDFSERELLAAGVPRDLLRQPNYVRSGTVIDGMDRFDAAFFGCPPREAEVMDPQHRVFLECAWEALENAAIAPDAYAGAIGVFAGSGPSTYAVQNLMSRTDIVQAAGSLQVTMNNEVDSLATTVSYKLNLRGPSLAVQTFCSTSLVAVRMACQSLFTRDCDVALAGGVVITVPHGVGYLYQEGGILSPDGRCRTFDARAQGSVMGNGAGVVVLRRLEDAVAAGSRIYAVICGSAVNNDGVRKVGYTAPGLGGQRSVIEQALRNAGAPADTIDYIEAHGTATKLGDSVELDAMIQAFHASTPRKAFCALGSVKPNIGHLDRASGVAGLIKAALALHHGVIPPSLEFERASDDVDLANSAFYVNTQAREWTRADHPRRAGVSSFGLGGTNVHAIVEEAPSTDSSDPPQPYQLLVWSAKTAAALEAMTDRLLEHLQGHPEANLADIAWTLAVGRAAFNHRRMLVCADVADAVVAIGTKRYATREQTTRPGDAVIARTSDRQQWLDRVGRQWLDGRKVQWDLVFAGERRRATTLPTYPFERQRYWIDPAVERSAPTYDEARKKPEIADWFYRSHWADAPLADAATERGEWLVVGGGELGEAVAQRLNGRYTEEVGLLDGVNAVVHLASVTTTGGSGVTRFHDVQQRGYYSVLTLGQAMDGGHLVVVTRGMRAVSDLEIPDADLATLIGLTKVLGQENVSLRVRSVDVDRAGSLAEQADRIAVECERGIEPVVAWRAGVRKVEQHLPTRLEAKARFRERGVYLITGAFGSVGLTLAEHLARQYRARLVLVARRREGRAADIARLEHCGGQVLAIAADVADAEAMRAVIARAHDRFGIVHGVIHAAGISASKPLAELTRDDAEQHFRAKAEGLFVLEDVLAGEPALDFCVVFSSLSAVLGGLGFGAYAAANSFMGAFVARHNAQARGAAWTSVAWDTWRVKATEPRGLGATLAAYEMEPAEALDAFERAAAATGELLNSTGELEDRVRQWVLLESLQRDESETASTALDAPTVSRGDWEQRIARLWEKVLGVSGVGLEDNFFDLGGNSLIGLQLIALLRNELKRPVPAVALFEAPTVRALAEYLRPQSEPVIAAPDSVLVERRRRARQRDRGADIAVIAMTGRFPGADDVEQFWRNLRDGVESVARFTDRELIASGIASALIRESNYVKARPILNDVEHFDAALFGYSPRAAEFLDPQQRLFQECAWEALESAGYDARRYPGLIGVFAGSNVNSYLLRLANDPQWAAEVSDATVLENDKDALTTNVSYRLNLRGPSVAVQTFCSTSLVAVHMAVRSLRGGECDLALAGGVSVRIPVRSGYLYQEGDQLSKDGHCRTFDARADGTLFGDGVALVVLKRLEDAMEDGDTIRAVIRGTAINNDGGLKVGYTAPSIVGQSEVVAAALADAGVSADEIEYVEAHGTATRLGDPVEVASLTKAFRQQTARRGYCAIGSVKSNIGHLDRASGVTGLIKTVLALERETIPATLHFERPNPEIDFDSSPFCVATDRRPWPRRCGSSRRAGVNSLGVGGTNAHVIVEEAPAAPRSGASRSTQLLVLSARTEAALDAATARLRSHLAAHPEIALADVAFTLHVGRRVLEHRRALVCRNRDEALALLDRREPGRVWTMAATETATRGVALVVGGAETLSLDAGRELYESESAYRAAVDQCTRILKSPTKHEVRDALCGARRETKSPDAVTQFVLGWAEAQMWASWGVVPAAALGYGIGAYIAACLSGVLSLEDALRFATGDTTAREGRLHPPRIPMLSAIEGTWISAAAATDPEYWVGATRRSDRFADAVANLRRDNRYVVLEAGAPPTDRTASRGTTNSAVERVLTSLGQLWLHDVAIDWTRFYAQEQRRRVPLPVYPFERRRCWLEPALRALPEQTAHASSGEHEKKKDVADWFYLPVWEPAPLAPVAETDDRRGPVLVILGDSPFAQRLAERLERGSKVIRVRLGDRFERTADRQFVLRSDERADYASLFRALAGEASLPESVMHLGSIGPAVDFDAEQRRGLYSLMALAQALGEHNLERQVRIAVVTDSSQMVTGTERLRAEQSLGAGVCKVVSQECLSLVCRSVDICVPPMDGDPALLDALANELAAESRDVQVAYRDDVRLVQRFRAERIEPVIGMPPRLRSNGVYLITGGTGGIGLHFAEYLARTVSARLVLLSRSGRRADQEDTLRRLEDLGAEVLVLGANVADAAEMRLALAEIEVRFGGLHGVIHAAGNLDPDGFGPLDGLTRARCERHFDAKVRGLFVLEEVLAGRPLDFCILVSSMSSILGGLGDLAYTAANCFMDAFTSAHNQTHPVPWTSVNWDAWKPKEGAKAPVRATLARYELEPDEGVEVLARVMTTTAPRLVNSTGDLDARIRQWVQLESVRDAASAPASTETFAGDHLQRVAAIWRQVLGVDEIGLHDNFFDLGGNSLIGLQVIARLKKEFKVHVPAVALFEAPTVSALAAYLKPEPATTEDREAAQLAARRERAQRDAAASRAIAVIGFTGRFPGAPSAETFWSNLRNGVESIRRFTDEELLASGVNPRLLADASYVKARPVLDDVELFDAALFGYTPREAELLDPQQRLFQECAWEALERAGYDTARYQGLVGVFGGANLSEYLLRLANDPEWAAEVTQGTVFQNDKDALTSNVSYKLNLRGPSMAVQTFCSTSLVAVHLASRSLRAGECDLALAGGVSIKVPAKVGYLYKPGDQESSDGHCRTFDARADGTVFGDGVGVVALKRLADAIEDGDPIHAVILGTAVNNDGALKVGYTAPSVVGQTAVVEAALTDAGVRADAIDYVEAHGTATALGDPIEVAALTKAFRRDTSQRNYCAIGSVKPNVGHLDRAAGVTGLIKTIAVLQHGEVPPLLHYTAPNPEVDLASSPFYIPRTVMPLPASDGPRRACVNSLGVGGTNAHVVLEGAPPRAASGRSRGSSVFVLSAKSPSALDRATARLADHLTAHPTESLADVSYTLTVGRRAFEWRRALVASDRNEALARLRTGTGAEVWTATSRAMTRPVAFVLAGVGEQSAGVGRALYAQERIFREAVDRCAAILQPLVGRDVREAMFGEATSASTRGTLKGGASGVLTDVRVSQPAAFVLDWALARMWIQWGVQPAALLGYSVGEYVGAALAGVLRLEDALTLVARRAAWIAERGEPGVLVAVPLPAATTVRRLGADVWIVAANSSQATIVGGRPEAIAALEATLAGEAITTRRVETGHAFHTPLLAAVQSDLTALAARMTRERPRIPLVSNVTGTWWTAREVEDASYWSQHLCSPVQFEAGVAELLRAEDQVLLELGPGGGLSAMIRQHPACPRERMPRVLASLPSAWDKEPECAHVAGVVGQLWTHGVGVDWSRYFADERRHRVVLPTYPFERQRYWVEPQTPRVDARSVRRAPIDESFYVPSWKRSAAVERNRSGHDDRWLVLADDCGIGEALARRLPHAVIVDRGDRFERVAADRFRVRAAARQDFDALLDALEPGDRLPSRVVHLWTVSEGEADDTAGVLQRGFYSVLALTQALGERSVDACRIDVVTSALHEVTGTERTQAAQAVILGPVKVIPQEYPNLQASGIDIVLDGSRERLLDHLTTELLAAAPDSVVALRGPHRWIQSWEPVQIERDGASRLRRGGVYLLTGGLGGIALAVAEHLAARWDAKLVLLARTRRADRLERVRALEARGAEVLVLEADVADPRQVRAAVDAADARFGRIDGVLHMAGVPGLGMMQWKSADAAERVLAPKITGTLALAAALGDRRLDFFLLFGSLTSVTGGGPGQADYCAANAFLDAWAQSARREYGALSVSWGEWQWDAWQEGLAGFPEEARAYFIANRKAYGLRFDEGCDALDRVLTTTLPHVVVSMRELTAMVEESRRGTAAANFAQLEARRKSRPLHPRPALSTSHVDPREGIEQEMAAVWRDMLGLAEVGRHDNFFELGGNSLLGLGLIARLRKQLKLERLPAHVLYEASTIAALAEYLEAGSGAVAVPDEAEVANRKRREKLQRMRQKAKREVV